MPDWILFVPILFPLFGAVGFGLAALRVTSRVRVWLPVAYLVLEIAAVLVNVGPSSHRAVLSDWQLASFALSFQTDGNVILLSLCVLVLLLAAWLATPPRSPYDLRAALIVSAALALMNAASLIAIYLAWTLLDLSIFVWRQSLDMERAGAMRALFLGQLAGLMLFAGALLAGTPFSREAGALVALAFWARLGLFPFQWMVPPAGAESGDLWTARGIPLVAGASLWLRWPSLGMDMPSQWIGILAALNLVAGALWSFKQGSLVDVAGLSIWHAVALVPLAVAYGGEAGIAYGFWILLGTAFGLALFELALRWRAENRNRWVRLLWIGGLVCLSNLPLTPAFVGRMGLYVALWESGEGLLVLLAAACTLVLLMPLWALGLKLEGPEPRDPRPVEYAGMGLAAAGAAALSLGPLPIMHLLGPAAGESAEAAILQAVRTNDAAGVGIGLLAVLVPVVLAFFLRPLAAGATWGHFWLGQRAAQFLELDWLGGTLAAVGYQMGVAARNASAMAEENPTVWILLVAIWFAIFVLIPR